MNVLTLIDTLQQNHHLTREEYGYLLTHMDKDSTKILYEKARQIRETYYGKKVYTRGLIEFTNYCKNNCLYCGIRSQNPHVNRYRLTHAQILECVEEGYDLGFRTFVLQGGEDLFYTPKDIGTLVTRIKKRHPDCAVTLSVGEQEREVYTYWYECGADRYLLRHETATREHYEKLHPKELSFDHRIQCLYTLKEIGYQVGAGFMVGSPYQTTEHLVNDILFLKDLQPDMVGIGPFIAQKDSVFAKEPNGTLEQTLLLLAVLRLTLPKVLLPATTALGTIHPQGREMGILAGGNVVMPNLSPVGVREKYQLYDNKICTGEESAQCRTCLQRRMESVGYEIVTDRGDHVDRTK